MTGSVTTANPVPHSPKETSNYTSFTFTDCVNTYTNLNTSVVEFDLSTNAQGQIDSGYIVFVFSSADMLIMPEDFTATWASVEICCDADQTGLLYQVEC